MEPFALEVLHQLRQFNAPTVANAVETFNVRPRNEGFMDSGIRCLFPEMGVMVGYAVTAKIRAAEKPAPGKSLAPSTHWENILKVPAPRVVIVQDLDDPPAVGSFWGEVNGSVHSERKSQGEKHASIVRRRYGSPQQIQGREGLAVCCFHWRGRIRPAVIVLPDSSLSGKLVELSGISTSEQLTTRNRDENQ